MPLHPSEFGFRRSWYDAHNRVAATISAVCAPLARTRVGRAPRHPDRPQR